MATIPFTTIDTFSRTASGWGSTDNGHVWRSTGETFWSTDGDEGVVVVDAATFPSWTYGYIDLDSHNVPIQRSAEVLMKVRWTSTSAWPITNFGPILNLNEATNTFYMFTLQGNYSEVAITAFVNGTPFEVARKSFSLTKNTNYWVRFRNTGEKLLAKIWSYGSQEPSAWTISTPYYDGAGAPNDGHYGVGYRKTTTTHTVYVDTFYGYTLEDESPTTQPVVDTFERNVDRGWGLNENNQAWEGHFGIDAVELYSGPYGSGDAVDAADGYGRITTEDTSPRTAMLGPARSGNVEYYTEFQIDSNVTSPYTAMNFGFCGAMQYVAGVLQNTGYVFQLRSGGTNFSLFVKASMTGGYSGVTLSTNTAFTALAANTTYSLRIQKSGSTLRARVWPKSGTEPSTWQAEATESTLTSGRPFLMVQNQNVPATARTFRMYTLSYGALTSTTNHTTTGTISSVTITDVSMALSAFFTNDSNANNSISVRYRVLGTEAWSTHSGSKTRVSSTEWRFTLTGLERLTTYQVEVTFNDADDVTGTNPRLAQFTTAYNGLTPLPLTLGAVGPTSVVINAPYAGDTNNNSTATLAYRKASVRNYIARDTFTGSSGTPLVDHIAESGGNWLPHPISGVISTHAELELWRGRVYSHHPENSGTLRRNLYYYETEMPQSEYEVSADIYVNALNVGNIGITARMRVDGVTTGFYLAEYSQLGTTGRWSLWRNQGASWSSLGDYYEILNIGEVYNLLLIVRDGYKSLRVNGVERIRTSDNAITGVTGHNYVGLRREVILKDEGSPDNQLTMDDYTASYRTPINTYSSEVAMGVNRTTKIFSLTPSSLDPDTIYEFRTTYADADGLYNVSQDFTSAQTLGSAAQLSSILVSPQATSAVVDALYIYDTNENSSIAVQYRSLMNQLWTTVPIESIIVNRGAKKFSTTLSGLLSNHSYEVKVTITDPNGLMEGSPTELVKTFSTLGYGIEDNQERKHYIWKVFDPDNDYITTWHDAGEPEFSWHENGGVSDLTASLHRPITSTYSEKSGVAHQNRIDIWCIDPSSDGFGVNLITDDEFTLGAWTLGSNATINTTEGPDGTSCLKIVAPTSAEVITRSEAINLFRELNSEGGTGGPVYPVPYIIKAVAKATASKLRMYVESYDRNDVKLDTSAQTAETVGIQWQILRIEYTPPSNASYMRVCFENDDRGTMWADKVSMRPKELMIYRGRIESFTREIDQGGEHIEVEILGLVSLLSDDYIDFLQFVRTQPQKDFEAGRENRGPTDPAEMMRLTIDIARAQNPRFSLYYTDESIRNTGNSEMQYTFRDQQIRAIFDKIRDLCPSGWHYYIEPDGLVVLRGPEHAAEHTLRIGVEILTFSAENSIRNLKNYVRVKGRQDEDESEPDGFGSIFHVAFDQASINRYGRRRLNINDANLTDPDSAEIVAEGRLEEHNREELRVQAHVPDEKSIQYVGGALRGMNIETFRPGDNVYVVNPLSEPIFSYWDQMVWDNNYWNAINEIPVLPESVPIKTVQFHGDHALLELSERQPSSIGDFGRLYRFLQLQEADRGNE